MLFHSKVMPISISPTPLFRSSEEPHAIVFEG